MLDTLRRQAIEHWLNIYGPESAGPPPGHIVEALVALYNEELPEVGAEALCQRAEELVVAYGAGWRRETLGAGGWEGRWASALGCVTRHVHGWMLATSTWLYAIPLQGYAYTVPFPPWDEAWVIARDFWLGTCGCWRVFYREGEPTGSVHGQVDETAPEPRRDARRVMERADRCGRTHRLDAWNPLVMSLWHCIARAVKGDKRTGQRRGAKGFAPVAFSYSMFFCHLYQDVNVHCGQVLSWCCPQHPDIPFEGPQCLECRDRGDSAAFHATTHHRRVQTRLLVAAPTGRYGWQRF